MEIRSRHGPIRIRREAVHDANNKGALADAFADFHQAPRK